MREATQGAPYGQEFRSCTDDSTFWICDADRSRRSAAVCALGKRQRTAAGRNSTVGPTVRPCLPHRFLPKPHFLRAPP